jgi:hypothetical protein
MRDHNDLNRELAELLGVPHYSWKTKGMDGKDYIHSDPDFISDPRLVLREMRKRKDWDEFFAYLLPVGYNLSYRESAYVLVDYITDTTGLLAKAAVEWLRKEK